MKNGFFDTGINDTFPCSMVEPLFYAGRKKEKRVGAGCCKKEMQKKRWTVQNNWRTKRQMEKERGG